MSDRQPLLERLGRYYGQERFAITFTAGITGEDAKRVTSKGWDKTAPLADASFGSALIAGRGLTRNVAVVLRPSNLIVLECDTEADLARIQTLQLPITLTVRSSKPYKRHFYFRPAPTLEALPYVAFRFESGKLTADSGRYFLAPPSIHPSGTVYAFLPDLGPDDVDIAELPEHTYRELSQQAQRENTEQRDQITVDPDAKIRAGNRRDMIFRYACMLRRWGLSRHDISQQCHAFNELRCDPPVEHDLVEVQVDGAMKKQGDQELARASQHPPTQDSPPTVVLEQEPHSWTPVDLILNANEPPEPPTISGLVYPGRRHLFSGEPESLKSWAAMVLCVEQIRAGNTAMYIDFEMGGRETLARLRDMGVTDSELADRFIYLEPDEPFHDPMIKADIEHLLSTRRPTIIIIDAFTGALQVHQLDPNKSIDVETFYRKVVDPLRAHNAGVVVLDHLAKDPTSRGRFAIGSERKVGAAEVHLGFEVIAPFGRGRTGRAKITTHKDRPGYLNRPRAADIELTSSPTTGDVTWKVELAQHSIIPTRFRPTYLMERVSRYLEPLSEHTSRNDIEKTVKGNAAAVRTAIDLLVLEGFVARENGLRGAHMLLTKRAYRESFDVTSSTSSDLVSTSSGRSAGGTSSDLVPPNSLGRSPGDEDEVKNQLDLVQPDEVTDEPEDAGPPDDHHPMTGNRDRLLHLAPDPPPNGRYAEAEQLVRDQLWQLPPDTVLETIVDRWPMIPTRKLDELRALAATLAANTPVPVPADDDIDWNQT